VRPVAALAALAALAAACAPRAPDPVISPDGGRPYAAATRFLDSAIAAGAAPGAVLGVSYRGNWYLHGTGIVGLEDSTRPGPGTVYDLASLTKVVGLTTGLMLAVDSGLVALDAPVTRYVPSFAGGGHDQVTLRLLLAHASGLPAWRPLYREATDRAGVFALVDSTPLDTVPGTRFTYSDLGAILLTRVLESVYHGRLDSVLAARVFLPLGMLNTGYLPPASWLHRIAPTELDPWRNRMIRGEVHDENAARMDGVSGHAGLFSTAPDLLLFGDWLLRAAGTTADPLPVSPRTVAEFLAIQRIPAGSSRALGWDTPSPGSSAGQELTPTSFGHTGFTGTSIWIDPARDLVLVLLTNRVHPSRENNGVFALRRGVADRVVQGLPR